MAIFFAGGNLKVIAASGSSVTVQGTPNSCGGGKTAELRRPGEKGIMEFVGDVTGSSSLGGGKYSISYDAGSLPSSTRPKVGESLIIYCSNAKSSSSGSRDGAGTKLPGAGAAAPGGVPWIYLIGGGLLLYFVMKD